MNMFGGLTSKSFGPDLNGGGSLQERYGRVNGDVRTRTFPINGVVDVFRLYTVTEMVGLLGAHRPVDVSDLARRISNWREHYGS